VRVIAGEARGRKLVAPPGRDVRPTLDRVREAVFSILGPQLEGAAFLDLFAGSGANGIEALSRGAQSATFVDADEKALAAVRKNLAATGFEAPSRCVRCRFPEEARRVHGVYDVIFADPPYGFSQYEALLRAIEDQALLADNGRVLIEHRHGDALCTAAGQLVQRGTRRYGDSAVSFYGRSGPR